MNRRDTWRLVAELHAAAIDRGFLSTLGVRFLGVLYRAIDEAPESILIVRRREGRVAGFITGSKGMSPVWRQLLRHPLALGAALAPVLVQPRKLAGILDVLRAPAEGAVPAGLPPAELLSLAVDPRFRRDGIAESLYRELVQAFAAMGIHRFRILVGDSLDPAQRFYRRMGAVPVAKAEIHPGQGSTIFVHTTSDQHPEGTNDHIPATHRPPGA